MNIIGVMTGTEIALERMKKVRDDQCVVCQRANLFLFGKNMFNILLQQTKKGTIVNTASMAGIMTGSEKNVF